MKKPKKAPVAGLLRGEKSSPGMAIASLWAVCVFFALYGATTVRDELAKNELVALWTEDTQQQLTALAEFGERVGLSQVQEGLEALRTWVNQPRLVLEAEASTSSATISPPKPSTDLKEETKHQRALAKHRILVIGASSIQFAMGVELERKLPAEYGVAVKRFGKLATGLSRPDFFNWPKKVGELASKFRPDLVIANFGGNGAQNIPLGKHGKAKFGTEAWNELYTKRVQELIAVSEKYGADIVFMGMSNMRSPKFARKMKRLNAVQKKAAEEGGALFISTWEMSSTPKGEYKKTLRYQGKRGLMRTSDGIHYRKLGAKFVADQVLQIIERNYILTPTDKTLARAERHRFSSTKSSETISYVAFIPQTATPSTPASAVYLWPGPQSAWSKWPNYPHRTLQKIAGKHSMALIVLSDSPPLNAQVLAEDIFVDVRTHLPVGEAQALLGVDITPLIQTLKAAAPQTVFKSTDRETFRDLPPLLEEFTGIPHKNQ